MKKAILLLITVFVCASGIALANSFSIGANQFEIILVGRHNRLFTGFDKSAGA
ncbi:MAG: hypothetical protein ACYTEU_05365 [Planctomycetota bacterium]